MKQLFSILIAMSFLFTTYSQKADSLPIPDTAKLTLGKVYSDVKNGINGLAQSLKVPATHVYGIMIKQQTTRAISDLIFDMMFILLSFILYSVGMKAAKKLAIKKTDEIETVCIISFVCCCISTLIAVCSFWSDYSGIVSGFVNPEYGAIKEIISFVK